MTCQFRCDGGWVPVNDEYVTRQMATYREPKDQDAYAQRRKVIRESIYPCPSCRPELYDRWRGGHLVSGHYCQECYDRRTKRASMSSSSKP